ncbi:hypothetical protein GMD78_17340 [Ornithinibacillus sp. L9]|uniref:Uncharacterized protein n=1 Tax=Ornithinibacillus caprae TaxID=2678566 RepID=A0A6N8FKG1_9BACI|nr:hypothetical protein [Ornithinibacillus caprae]
MHFQYNGWLYLALIGMFLIVLHKKKIKVNDSLARLGFWIYFLALVPGYFTSVLWVDLGEFSIVLAIIGAIGQWIGVLSILLSFMQIREKIKLHYSQFTRWGVWITFLLLFVKSTMELGLTIPQLAALIYDTRSVIIGYLHLTLLGFVSIFIVTLFFMLKILQPNVLSISGFMIFLIGFTLNEMVLFIQAFMDWIYDVSVPYSNHFLLIASSLLLFGILLIWISFLRKTWIVPDC